MDYYFRRATQSDAPRIWEILEQAIRRRKEEGSEQWQDGYPNPSVIESDLTKGAGFVLTDGSEIIGYAALLINDEPEYANIEGKWLTNKDFVAVHRMVVSEEHLGKGLAKKIFLHVEDFALRHNIYSIKADTNFDNAPMLKIFEQLGYTYCGQVYFRGTPRRAYEKVLIQV